MNENNNGWDYKTEITPENLPKVQTLQTVYLQNYTNAYNKMMREFLVDKDDIQNTVNNLSKTINPKTKKAYNYYNIVMDCSYDNDIINKDDEYAVKFNKSKFLDLKKFKIKQDLIKYYKPMNFYIKGPFILIKNENTLKYCIELCWKN
tara:strand:+ start:773 stop:1216 length:444 start_codon:yes stop_codon:yes gene_type:complete